MRRSRSSASRRWRARRRASRPLALSTATRKSLVARKPLCDDLRKYAGEASGAGDVEPQDLQRVKPHTVLACSSALAIAI